jgi:hypothetical protein
MIPNAIRCPYCRTALGVGQIVRCSECKTIHHTACWFENHGCTIFGCHGQPEESSVAALAVLPAFITVLASINSNVAVLLSFILIPAVIACSYSTLYHSALLIRSLAIGTERCRQILRHVAFVLINLAPLIGIYLHYFGNI